MSNGPIQQWKDDLTTVMQANPPTESRKLESGTEILNATIFRHLKEMGWSPQKMGNAIPTNTHDLATLGELYGYTIGLDYRGRFQFYSGEQEMEEAIMVLEDSCEHGFVVRDIQEDNRFLCRECDERFPRHPDMIEQEVFRPDKAEAYDHLAQFRDGLMTFAEAAKKTQFTLEEFKGAIEKIFPAQLTSRNKTVNADGSMQVSETYGPKRTSCPAQIEALFGDPEVTVDNINTVIQDKVFADITKVEHIHCPDARMMVVEISFVDDTMQRVEIIEITTHFTGKQMRRRFEGSRHICEPGMFQPKSKITETEKVILIKQAYKWATEK